MEGIDYPDSVDRRHEVVAGGQGVAIVILSSPSTNAFAKEQFAVLFQNMLLNGASSMGEAMIKAKQAYDAEVGLRHKDILWGVTWLGDPLLRL